MPKPTTDGYRKSIDILFRMLSIIQRIQNKTSYVESRDVLMEYLSDEGYATQARTLDRDLAAINEHFGINIEFNRSQKRYEIKEDADEYDLARIQKLIKLASQYQNAESLIVNQLAKNKYIQYEAKTDNPIILTMLSDFLEAITTQRIINFKYHKFNAQEASTISLEPMMVKQNQNRWYLIGYLPESSRYGTYGLERIDTYTVTTKKYKFRPELNLQEELQNNFGAFLITDEAPITIQIKVPHWRAAYLLTQPLHHSQNMYHQDDTYHYFEYHLIPNPQFVSALVALSPESLVLSPDSMKKLLVDNLQNSLSLYMKS
jgi:predicted DNA-binding transcriptional regulator YafY